MNLGTFSVLTNCTNIWEKLNSSTIFSAHKNILERTTHILMVSASSIFNTSLIASKIGLLDYDTFSRYECRVFSGLCFGNIIWFVGLAYEESFKNARAWN